MNNHVGLEKRLFTPQRAVHVIGITRRDFTHCVLLLAVVGLGVWWAQEYLLDFWALILPSGELKSESAVALRDAKLKLAIVSLVAMVGSHWISEQITPLKYFIRFWGLTVLFVALGGLCFQSIQFSQFDFAQFMMRTSSYSSWSLLAMLALGYYILPYSLLQKFVLTVLVLAHNAITCWLLTGLSLQVPSTWAAVLNPVFCLFFGPLLHFAWFIGFYSWALTWSRRV